MEEILRMDLANLSYGALFVGLLIYTTKRSELREDKLINVLDKIVPRLEIIEDKVDRIIEKEGK
mgnify:CR=1 FL=1